MNIFGKLSLASYLLSFVFLLGILHRVVGTPFEDVVLWIGGILFMLGVLLAALQGSEKLDRRVSKKRYVTDEDLDRLQKLIDEKKKELLEKQRLEEQSLEEQNETH